jgi:DNA-binding transcriptional LysR family regulator
MLSLLRKLPSAHALFVFEAAARCGNFTRAAQDLFVSQPAVSRMLSKMEERLGVRLFERLNSGMALTEYGRILFAGVTDGLGRIDRAIEEIEAKRTGAETVTLSVSTAFATHWLMPRMHQLTKAFPNVELRFQLIPAMLNGPLGDVDIGIRYYRDDQLGAGVHVVAPEILVPICSRSYENRGDGHAEKEVHGDTLIDLDANEREWHQPFLARRRWTEEACATLSFSDYSVVVQAAISGQGVALGWLASVSYWLANGVLIPAEKIAATTERYFCLVSRQDSLRPVISQIVDWLEREMLADMAQIDELYPQLAVGTALRSLTDGGRVAGTEWWPRAE